MDLEGFADMSSDVTIPTTEVSAPSNSVWDTLGLSGFDVNKAVSGTVNTLAQVYTARKNANAAAAIGASRVQASPGGVPTNTGFNLFPGLWGSNPQAQAAEARGVNPNGFTAQSIPGWLIGVGVLLVLYVFMKAR